MKKTIFLILFLTILIGCQKPTAISFENGATIEAEIADTAGERREGLMDRENLGVNEGMLFIFESEWPRIFWMKDTLIPLDIIFLDSQKKIIGIQTMQPCTKDPCKLHESVLPVKYAIEVNAGYCAQNNIKIGQKVSFK